MATFCYGRDGGYVVNYGRLRLRSLQLQSVHKTLNEGQVAKANLARTFRCGLPLGSIVAPSAEAHNSSQLRCRHYCEYRSSWQLCEQRGYVRESAHEHE